MAGKGKKIGVYLGPEVVELLERLVEHLSARARGWRVSRSGVVAMAIRALASEELGKEVGE